MRKIIQLCLLQYSRGTPDSSARSSSDAETIINHILWHLSGYSVDETTSWDEWDQGRGSGQNKAGEDIPYIHCCSQQTAMQAEPCAKTFLISQVR